MQGSRVPMKATAAPLPSKPGSDSTSKPAVKPAVAAKSKPASAPAPARSVAKPAAKPPLETKSIKPPLTKPKSATATLSPDPVAASPDAVRPEGPGAAKPAVAKPAAGKPGATKSAAAAPASQTAADALPEPPTIATGPAIIAEPSPQPAPNPDVEAAAPPTPRSEPPRPNFGRPDQRSMQMSNGRPMPPSRAAAKEELFVEGDYVVYPTHGVGKVEKIAIEDIAGHHLELIHITFEENRMTLRVPVAKARSAGLRKLATRKMFDEALAVLKGRARIKRTMWSRRAQEYEAKINSGDPIAIAEVVRDLHRNAGQPDQSFSERQIYEAAMDRLAAELGALDQTDKTAASLKLGNYLKTV